VPVAGAFAGPTTAIYNFFIYAAPKATADLLQEGLPATVACEKGLLLKGPVTNTQLRLRKKQTTNLTTERIVHIRRLD
jgi:hypothetical protein